MHSQATPNSAPTSSARWGASKYAGSKRPGLRRQGRLLLAIGTNEATSREAWSDKHLGDVADLSLMSQQEELAAAMFSTGKPVIVVLVNGRPVTIPRVAERASAILETWYAGQESGTAIAEVIFGDVNPGGNRSIGHGYGHRRCHQQWRACRRRGRAALSSGRRQLGYATDEGTARLRARLTRAKRDEAGQVPARVRRAVIDRSPHDACGRAGPVRGHGRRKLN